MTVPGYNTRLTGGRGGASGGPAEGGVGAPKFLFHFFIFGISLVFPPTSFTNFSCIFNSLPLLFASNAPSPFLR